MLYTPASKLPPLALRALTLGPCDSFGLFLRFLRAEGSWSRVSWFLLWNTVSSVMLGMCNLLLVIYLEPFSVRPACNYNGNDVRKWWLSGSGSWFKTGKFYCSSLPCMRMFCKMFSTFVCWLQCIVGL